MKKDDYRAEFEEHRKEIKLNDGETLSRTDLHSKRKKPKKRSRYSLINVLLVLFTLIPIGILVFVIVSWNSPIDKIVNDAENSQFQFEKSQKPNDNQAISKDKEKERENNKDEEKEKELEEAKAKEEKEKAQKEQEEKERAKAEEEERKKEEARQQAEKEKQQAEAAQKEKENESQENTGTNTHIVAPGETLYRISVNYYKSGDGVNKIMQANGLTTNEISVGQKLIIP